MKVHSETVIEKVPVGHCPKCGKSHVYLINVEREVHPDEPGFGVVLSTEDQFFDVCFECPSLKESFPCHVSRVGRRGIKVCDISVRSVYRPSEAFAKPQEYLFELVDNLTYDTRACESNYQPWCSELMRIAIRAFRKESDQATKCLNFLERCRLMLDCTGMGPLLKLFDHLFALQKQLIGDQHYRDHIYHSICVFLLGHYILNQKSVLPNYLYFAEGGEPLPSLQCNKVFNHYCPDGCDGTQTIHNLDYDLEWPEVCSIAFYDDRLLQVYHNWNIAWFFASLFHDIGYPIEKDPTEYAMKFGITTTDTYRAQQELVGCHSVLNDIPLPIDGLLPRHQGSSNLLYDHGLVGASLVLKAMKSLTKESWAPIKRAALAIALHNLGGYRLDNRITIDANRDPLSFLLVLCDEIQEWGREELGGKSTTKPYVTPLDSLTVDTRTHLAGVISIEAILRMHFSQADVDSSTILKEVRERFAVRERSLRRFLQFQGRFHIRLAVYHQEELVGEIVLPDRNLWGEFHPGRISELRRRRISILEETLLSSGSIMHEEIQSALAEELRVLKEIDFEERDWWEAWGTA